MSKEKEKEKAYRARWIDEALKAAACGDDTALTLAILILNATAAALHGQLIGEAAVTVSLANHPWQGR